MCRLSERDLTCFICSFSPPRRKCPHELAVCENPAVHPLWSSWYYKNAGEFSTFQGCGFCRYAAKVGLRGPAHDFSDNPGWSGCCYPPTAPFYSWIPPEDWPIVAAYHRMEIPDAVQSALDNLNVLKARKIAAEKPSIEIPPTRSIQQPMPIPHPKGATGVQQLRSHSPSAIYLPENRSSHRGSISSKESNSSSSPPSSNGSRRREYEWEGSERSSNSPTSPIYAGSYDGHMSVPRPSSSLQNKRGGSPADSMMREKELVGGKRRSNSDPKTQSPPSAFGHERARDATHGRDRDREFSRDKDRDSPTQTRLKPPSPPASTAGSSTHPYSNPQSTAATSAKRLAAPKQVPVSSAGRPPAAPPRARERAGPSITSVMANMTLNPHAHVATPNGSVVNGPSPNHAAALAAARARIQQAEPIKRGVIPPHVRKAGSVVSVGSSSSSSTNSSAREGTVISDGAFTDYLSDDSDFDMQRQAEIEAENAYQEAMRKHEEMEFRQARDSLINHRIRV